jgi:hypothetical protein
MSDQVEYSGSVCRGSIVLGTACGNCERCMQDRLRLISTGVIDDLDVAFMAIFDWIKDGAESSVGTPPYRWIRADYEADHMGQSPVGEFFCIRHGTMTAYLRPWRSGIGYMDRIDVRGDGCAPTDIIKLRKTIEGHVAKAPPAGSPDPEEVEPPPDAVQYMAHYLRHPAGQDVSALWLQFDRAWLIHNGFISARLAASIGYRYARRHVAG